MKLKTKGKGLVPAKSNILDVYDSGGDPFDYLKQLKSGNKRSKELNPETIGNGSALRSQGSFSMDEKEIDIATMVREVVEEQSLVPKDVKIDDGDLPQAKNFFEWVTDDSFAGTIMTPYLEQLIWGIVTFGEYCYECSDLNYLFNTHKVDDTFSTFEDHVTLLDYGICPNCGHGKSYMVEKLGMHFYQELAVNAGQRCVTADTCILTEHGLMEIGEYAKNKKYGFSRFHLNVHNGQKLEQTTDFYRAKPERVHCVTLYNGMNIRGTSDHPVKTQDTSFKRLSDINNDDIIPIYLNQQVFGNKHIYFEDILETVDQKARDYTAKKYPTLFKSYSGSICSDMYKVLGLWVAEGRRAGISNKCEEVNTFYYNTLKKYINAHHIKQSFDREGNAYTSIKGHKGRIFFAELLNLSNKDLSKGSAKKEIPYNVRTSTKENVCAFLQGLYEGDGYVSRVYKKDNKHSVNYVSISKKLIFQLSAMLNNLGIAHRIRFRWTWATNGTEKQVSKPSWIISIRGEYLKRFKEQIGFLSVRKQDQLDHAIHKLDSRTNLVPYWYENLEFLEIRLNNLLDTFSKELKVFSLPYYERNTCEKFRTYKSKKTMGLSTIFGRNSENLSFSLRKLRKNKQRRLTKRKLLEICNEALNYSCYMTPNTLFAFRSLLEYCSEDIVYCKVIRNSISHKKVETYDFTLPETHQFITGGILSHNSGKSACVGGMLTPYLTHKMLKLQKPNAVYGIAGSTVLHGTFVALTYAQAKETLWEFYYGTLVESPWFQEYHSMLNYYGDKYGQHLLKFNDTFVQYRARNLLIYPAGPDKRVLRGRTRFFAACIPGNSLISTNHGLVRMDKIEPYMRVNIGIVNAPICVHKHTGKKQLWKLKLSNGQELYASADHKILCYRNDKIVKIKLGNVKSTDKVAYCLGGEFPDSLDLSNYVDVPRFRDERHRLVYYMLRLKEFTYTELHATSGTTRTRESMGVLVSKLVREGLVVKEQNGNYKEGNDRYVYTATSCLNIDDFLDTRNKGTYEYKHDIHYPEEMTEDLACILGYLTGDGYVVNKIKFKTLDRARTQHYIDCVRRVFKTSPTVGSYLEVIGKHEGRTEHTVRNYYANITVGCWVAFFRRIGMSASYSLDKEVPHTILQAPKNCIIAYLKALFECDSQNHRNTFIYYTISKKLALQVQQLLFRLGIDCKTGCRKNYLYSVKVIPTYYAAFLTFFSTLTIKNVTLHRITKNSPSTKYKEINYSNIDYIERTDEIVDVYDMTVDHKRHAYQADGILVSNCDEIGWFDNDANSNKVKTSAREVYDALDQSLLTIRGAADRLITSGFDDIPHGYSFNVSSPSSQADKICELVRISQNSYTIYGIHRPTWEVNPSLPRNCKAITSAYEKDPFKAERNLGANPPLSANPYITNQDWAKICLSDRPNRILIKDRVKNRKRQGKATKWAEITKLGRSRKCTMLTIDAGYSSNSFACSVGHVCDKTGSIIVDLFVEIMPEPGIPLNYTMIYTHILSPIIEKYNVRVVLADRWNSLKILSDIEAEFEIIAEQYSLKYKDIGLTKSFLESGTLKVPKLKDKKATVKSVLNFDAEGYPACYKNKPVEHFILQMLTVQDTGSHVNKGDGLTDDLWRATCLLVWGLTNEGYDEYMAGPELEDEQFRPQAFGVSKLGSGGGKSMGSGGLSQGGVLGVLKNGR